jgi:hypothetical protein
MNDKSQHPGLYPESLGFTACAGYVAERLGAGGALTEAAISAARDFQYSLGWDMGKLLQRATDMRRRPS